MEIILEFQWIKEVLESCETRKQINSSNRLFNQFLHKWEHEISEDLKNSYVNKYENLQKEQICKIVSGKNQ